MAGLAGLRLSRGTVSILVLAAAFCVFSALVFAGASGVRGSDQFWYLSEIRAVAEGDPRTNSLFPNLIQRDAGVLTARPFIHDTAYPYLVALLAPALGPYAAALAFNLALAGASAVFIFLAVLKTGSGSEDRHAAALAAALAFLFLPVTFWQASQPAPELALAFLCALCCYTAVSGLRGYAVFSLLVGLILAAESLRSIFEPALLVCAAAFIGSAFRDGAKSRWLTALYGLALSVSALVFLRLKEDTLPYSRLELAQNGATTGNNMELWLADGGIEPRLGDIALKALRNLLGFFEPGAVQLFLLPFTVLCFGIAALLAGLWLRGRLAELSRIQVSLIAIAGTAVAVTLAIVALHQNQFRYTLTALPALIVTMAALWRPDPGRAMPALRMAAAAVLLGLCLAANAVLAQRLSTEGRQAASRVELFQRAALESDTLRTAAVVMDCFRQADSLLMAYALPGTLFVHFDPGTGADYFRRTVEASAATALVCARDEAAKIIPELAAKEPAGRIGAGGEEVSIYDLSRLTAAAAQPERSARLAIGP